VPYADGLDGLLASADYVATSEEWPRQLTGLDDVEGGELHLRPMLRFPNS
jgi:hypothetical protein